MTPRGGEGLLQYSVTCQFAFFNRAVNSRQVLINNSARSEIKMADLRVAHLALRQTDVSPTGAQLRAWIIRVQLVVKGSGCEQRGVSVLVALFPARFCRRRCSLFSALGNPKAFRDYPVCRRRTFACPARAYARLRRWSR